MVGNEKSKKLSNTEIISKGSFVAIIITIPTLASFFGVWQLSDNLLYGAVTGLIVNFVAIGFSFKIVRKLLVKKQDNGTELNQIKMNVDFSQIENLLVSEIKLSPIQARIFLLVVTHGRMNAENIAKQLEISTDEASDNSKKLMELGGFIDMPDNEFEATHPRFTAVNMYRKMCEREQIEFKKNLKVDNIGVVLEKPYDDARAKYNNKK